MKLNIEKQRDLINQINAESKEYSYQPKDWDVWTISAKFEWENSEENSNPDRINEIYIPTYQRNLTWDNKKKSKFIESLFLNLPIPFIFLNKTYDEWEDYYDIPLHEIIDGSQRIRTITSFKNNDFKISWLQNLKDLNWLFFKDLPLALQRKFFLIPLRVVIFEWLSVDKRKEMFNRINTSSDPLTSMEVRRWTYEWTFYTLLNELSNSDIFKKLIPLSPKKINRDEWTELVLRYFAYVEKFTEYDWRVQEFLDRYMKLKSIFFTIDSIKEEIKNSNPNLNNEELELESNKILDKRKKEYKDKFLNMMNFVEIIFPFWFKKTKDVKVAASRVYFESISVWVWLALTEKKAEDLFVTDIKKLLESKEYKAIVTSDGANAKSKFTDRINIIKEYLLNWNYDRFTNWDN